LKKLNLIIVSIHIKNSPQAMPLAAALLKSQLGSIPEINDKTYVTYLDFYLGTDAQIIADQICLAAPELVGFSTYLWNRDLVLEVSSIIKKRLPDALLFAGGAEATALPEKLLKNGSFDFVIKGEGELALSEVVKKILKKEPYHNLDAVFVKNQINNPDKNQCPVMDLDKIPSPFLSGVIDIKKYSGVLWELSRGCPFKCSFCFESRGVAGVRQYSLDRIQKELELFESEKVNQVFVLDPTFNRDVKRAKEILRMIIKTAPLIHFTFEVRTEFLDAEMAGLFAMINCSLQIGLQSAIPEVLSNVNRNIDPEKYADKISLLNQAGVIFGLDLIYGLPGDTIEGFKHSLNYALTLQPNHLDIFPLAVLPGTELYDKAEIFNLKYLDDAPYTLISSPGFSISDMAAAESLKNACNIFYNQGGAAGWMFMIIETLDIEPAELLENYALHYSSGKSSSDISEEEITQSQLSFVNELFTSHGKKNLNPVMKDIILIHGALKRSLYKGPFTGELKLSFNDNTIFKLSPATEIVSLKYNFDELMSVGEFTLEEFIARFRHENTSVIIYNCRGEVKPLIVEKKLSDFLNALNGKNTLTEILKKYPKINKSEINEFIEYCLGETIIYSI
jgi:radical SAM superfamily enzyme YgiQ (UPF0313 family)